MSTLLAIRDLRWSPGSGDELLFDGLDFEVEAGELVVVSGPSGCGKSTLLRCLVGLETFEGSVTWKGEEVSNFRHHRRRVLFLQQRPVPIADTIGENLAFAREMAGTGGWSAEEQRDVLRRLQVRDWQDDERFDRLSGGEQQRVALVRGLTVNPDVLLLDEPTASLDDDAVHLVEELVLDWVEEEERAVVWVSHEQEQLERLTNGESTRLFEFEDDDE